MSFVVRLCIIKKQRTSERLGSSWNKNKLSYSTFIVENCINCSLSLSCLLYCLLATKEQWKNSDGFCVNIWDYIYKLYDILLKLDLMIVLYPNLIIHVSCFIWWICNVVFIWYEIGISNIWCCIVQQTVETHCFSPPLSLSRTAGELLSLAAKYTIML